MSGRVLPDQALAVPVEPVSRLDPSGFDPSRAAADSLCALLRMTVPVPAGCVAPAGSPMTPDFRVTVQEMTGDGIHFIIHAYGYSSDTLKQGSVHEGAGPKDIAQRQS